MTVDLRTAYLGLQLRSPLVASPSPLTGELDGLRRLETTSEHTGEALSCSPDLADYNTGPGPTWTTSPRPSGRCRCR